MVPVFYTITEVAQILRVDAATIYRAIREDEFPAICIRGRCIVPARVLEAMVEEVTRTGRPVSIASMTTTRQLARAAKDMNL